jgi:hypothetical protein
MPQVATQPCPHCGTPNPVGSTFCARCGKALPAAATSGGPRVLGKDDIAATAAGQKLQGDELHKQAKKASGALLAVAIIGTAAPVITYMIVKNSRGMELNSVVFGIMVAVAAIFWGLWVWSRSQPLPAAIVGLALYGTLVAINVFTAVSNMSQNEGRGAGGIGGIGIGWLDIIIMAVLVQAIQAGSKYRKLMAQQSAM